jgi:acetyltransferase
VLVRAAELAADLPEIAEFDINPLLADSRGVVALDARIRLAAVAPGVDRFERLAIRPYPEELERTVSWNGQPLLIRPIRPEDGAAHVAFFNALDPEDVRMRMFARMRQLQPSQLARFTQIDYDREMALIATRPGPDGVAETLGVGRVVADPDNLQAEFAVTIRSDLKRTGLGRLLMAALIDYCRARGTAEIVGEALADNTGMLSLASSLGFQLTPEREEGVVRMRLPLAALNDTALHAVPPAAGNAAT